LPSQSLVHGTIYLRDAQQRQQVIRKALVGQMPPLAATTAGNKAPEPHIPASDTAAGCTAVIAQQHHSKQNKTIPVPRAAAHGLAQRYGIALVNKRRDVSCVLNQWVNLLQQWLRAHDAAAAEVALREELTWLCARFSGQLQGMDCPEPDCVCAWEPFRKALQQRNFQG
jgi:hypothetical protein